MKAKKIIICFVSITFGIVLSYSVWAENEQEDPSVAQEIVATHDDTDVSIDEIHFPDEQFRSFVKTKYDKDNNGYLSLMEQASNNRMDLYNLGIYSLEGIEYFPDLDTLNCSNNFFKVLDISKNTNLTSLVCTNNLLESLDLSTNIKLSGLSVKNTPLRSITIPKSITTLDLSQTEIAYIDLNSCTELRYFTMNDVPSLKTLKIENTRIENFTCKKTGLLSLDLSNNTYIRWAHIYNNQQLSELKLGNDTTMERLWCDGCALSSLDLSGCPNLNSISINNQTRTVETVANVNLEDFYISLGSGVDSSKVSNVSQGRLDTASGRIYFDGIPRVDTITYQYSVGNNRKMSVTIPISIPYHEVVLHIPGMEDKNIIIDANNPVLPDPPEKEDAVFDGWFYDVEHTLPYVGEGILDNTTLYAKYNTVYLVTFIDGMRHTTSKVVENQLVEKPVDPTKTGYRFVGWYTSDKQVAWNFVEDKVNSHLVLMARFEKIKESNIEKNENSSMNQEIESISKKDEKLPLLQTNDNTAISTYLLSALGSLGMIIILSLRKR